MAKAKQKSGGNGGPDVGQIVADLQSRRHSRETTQMLERVVRCTGTAANPELWAAIIPVLQDLATSPKADPRARVRAISTLRAILADAGKAIVDLDKLDRLDHGEPTEHTRVSGASAVNLDDPKQAARLQRILEQRASAVPMNGNGANGNGSH